MAGTLAVPTTFAPAFSTTTVSPGMAAETFSDLSLDSYTGYVDIAASDEAIAQALGENFVPGANYSPAGDLVARAREFARELPQAGLFLARAGLLAADGAAGAGAGAGVAVAAARSAALAGGGLFAADAGDDEKVSGTRGRGLSSLTLDLQVPQERLAALRADITQLVLQGEALEKEGKVDEARAIFAEAAPIYHEMLVGLLPEAEINSTLEAAIALFTRAGDEKTARDMQTLLDSRRSALPESPETVSAGAAGQAGIVPPHISINIEATRLLAWLNEPSNPFAQRLEDIPPEQLDGAVREIVSKWFDFSREERLEVTGNPDQVGGEWFIAKWEEFLAKANRRYLATSAGERLAAVPADVVRTREAALQEPAEIVPPYTLAHIEIARYMGLFGNPDGSLYELAKDLSFPVMVQYTNLVVSRWFDMPLEERLAINPKNPDQVEEAWFTMAFAGLLEDRGVAKAAAPAILGGQIAAFRGTIINGINGLVREGEELESSGKREDAKIKFAAAASLYYGVLAEPPFGEGWLAESEIVEELRAGLALAERAGDSYLEGVIRERLKKSK